MTRRLIPTLSLIIAGFGFSGIALADEAEPESADKAAAELSDEIVDDATASRKGGGKGKSSSKSRSSKGKSSAKGKSSKGRAPAARTTTTHTTTTRTTTSRGNSGAARPPSSPASRPATGSPNRASSSPSARPSTARPSAARPPARSGTVRGSSSHAAAPRPAARPNPRSSSVRPHTPASRPAARPSTRPSASPRRTHRVHRAAYAPKRWAPAYHRYHLRGVPRHSPRYWATGVFIYNPPPKHHKVVIVEGSGASAETSNEAPTRAIDRNGAFSIGVHGGSYMTGYETGGGYGDFGLGLNASFRPVESVGFQVDWTHNDHTWDGTSERSNNPLQASAQLFAFPWSRVSPFATVGVTWNSREISDTYWDGFTYQITEADTTLFGPHAGLGVEFALGDRAALDLEARYISYLNKTWDDPSSASAAQATAGVSFYF